MARSCCALATATSPATTASTVIWSPEMRTELGRAALVALGLAFATTARTASAYDTEQEHLTDDTAWTRAGDKAWRIGLFKAAVGLRRPVSLGHELLPLGGSQAHA